MALDRDPNHVFRDFVTAGLPSSGNWNPRKLEIRQLLTEWWQTLIALVADAGELELPNLLISMTVTGGDENNIIAEANLPVPSGPGVAVFSIVIEEANTGPVTINGKPLLSNTGNPLAAGALAADGIYLFLDNGDSYRLLSDYVSASIVAAAEDAAERAETFAAGVEFPVSFAPQTLTPEQQEQARENIGAVGYSTTGVMLTVGSGGDFATINEALSAASRLSTRLYVYGGFPVEIKLLSGFQMAEQVFVSGVDLSFISITSDDAEVTIIRSALTNLVDDGNNLDYPAFAALNGGKLPRISALFNMDNSGNAAGRSFVYCSGLGSSCVIAQGCGCKNPGERGIEARYQSTVHAHNTIFTNAGGRALYALHQGRIFAEYANCDGASGDIGVYALMGGEIMFTNGSCNGKKNSGPAIWANRGGKIVATEATANDCENTSSVEGAVYASDCGIIVFDAGSAQNSSGNGITAQYGGVISARNANVTGAAQDGVRALHGGRIDFNGGTANSCGNRGLYAADMGEINGQAVTATGCGTGAEAAWGGRVIVRSGTLSGSSLRGVNALRGGYINAGLANCQRGGSPDPTDIVVATNGKIDAAGATGGLSQTANTITSAGLINQ